MSNPGKLSNSYGIPDNFSYTKFMACFIMSKGGQLTQQSCHYSPQERAICHWSSFPQPIGPCQRIRSSCLCQSSHFASVIWEKRCSSVRTLGGQAPVAVSSTGNVTRSRFSRKRSICSVKKGMGPLTLTLMKCRRKIHIVLQQPVKRHQQFCCMRPPSIGVRSAYLERPWGAWNVVKCRSCHTGNP